jgi:hypothetical protein
MEFSGLGIEGLLLIGGQAEGGQGLADESSDVEQLGGVEPGADILATMCETCATITPRCSVMRNSSTS